MKKLLLITLGVFAFALSAKTFATSPNAPLTSECSELPFDSFPPNQLLRQVQKDGHAFSLLNATKPGAWGEYFIQVDQPGSYQLSLTALKGHDRGIVQASVNGEAIGAPFDLYAPKEASSEISLGTVTFLKAGNYPFRFLITGKSASSSGYTAAFQRVALTPAKAFTLLSPNGSYELHGNVLLRWNEWGDAKAYRVEIDGVPVATVEAPATTYAATKLSSGNHRWRVVAITKESGEIPSNEFSFGIGAPASYPFRDYAENFNENLTNWSLQSMVQTSGALESDGTASAVLNDVALEKWEGEVSVTITPESSNSVAGVGFQATDGTRIYAIVDLTRGQLRIERRVKEYSIFEVTPEAYQIKEWNERSEGESKIWEITAKPIFLKSGISYRVKLAFSRRSSCVMATLIPSNGSGTVTLRGLSDLVTPDHPLLLALAGKNKFSDMAFTRLNKRVYKWDPESYRIVLRPGAPGSWDSVGVLNPAVLVRNGAWYMIYRGNAVPAPPNGPPASDLGLATSTDGIHWVKSPANPIITRNNPKDSQEDPDFLWPQGSNCVCLEHVTHSPLGLGADRVKEQEVMQTSTDWIHWSEPWIMNSGKTWGKIGGMIDTHNEQNFPEILFNGTAYRYIAMIEEGRIDLSQDLHTWVKAGRADLNGKSDRWCDAHECSGDIFVDADHNIRYESQAGVNGHGKKGGAISGNPPCTIVEGVLSGTNPAKVLWKSDLPWLPDWYGDAPTGAPEDFTASNGSVFPGQTIIKDGWLWHFSGGNNTFTVLSKCWYGPLFECRDLESSVDNNKKASVTVTVRNVGSLNGEGKLTLMLDGKPLSTYQISLNRDEEQIVHFTTSIPSGIHTLSVEDLSVTVDQ